MSSLIPERQLLISPSLAATIGLEEAVLLPVLCDMSMMGQNEPQDEPWVTVSCHKLLELLPFWDTSTLQSVSQRLCDQGIIMIDSNTPLAHTGHLRFAISSGVFSLDTSTPVIDKKTTARSLPPHWEPDDDLLKLLEFNHQIPRDFALEQLEGFQLYWQDRKEVSHSWSSKFRQHVLKAWRCQESRVAQSDAEGLIPANWQPSEEALDILQRSDVNQAFIEDAVPEFVLYWRERRDTSGMWCTKFINHIRRQWERYTLALESDYEPKPIAEGWQPSDDVFDVLQLATIDIDFARALLPEFVLFWRDTKAAHRSWNTKFLQHVKYHWALHHNKKGIDHATQSRDHQPGQAKEGSLIKRLTDRSWAKGIVEGV